MTILVVTGSRDAYFAECAALIAERIQRYRVSQLWHGGCPTGADKAAEVISRAYGVSERVFNAHWDVYGRAAGPIRNRQMMEEVPVLGPNHVLALLARGAKNIGTNNAIKEAQRLGLPVEILWVEKV